MNKKLIYPSQPFQNFVPHCHCWEGVAFLCCWTQNQRGTRFPRKGDNFDQIQTFGLFADIFFNPMILFLVTFLHRWRGTHFPENKRKMIGFKNIQYHYKLCEKRYKLPGVPHSEVVAARKMGSMQKMQAAISNKNWGWAELGCCGGNHIGCSVETEWRKRSRIGERWSGGPGKGQNMISITLGSWLN